MSSASPIPKRGFVVSFELGGEGIDRYMERNRREMTRKMKREGNTSVGSCNQVCRRHCGKSWIG